MKKILTAALSTSVLSMSILPSSVFASALVQKDDQAHTLKVIARMMYSGPEANDEMAESSTSSIQRDWSQHPTAVTIDGKKYQVSFAIDYAMGEPGSQPNSKSCAYNWISVMKPAQYGDRSLYEGLGSNKGVFYTSDISSTTHTQAHEFGHGLTLDHNDLDQVSSGTPGIMFARGTAVASEFRYVSTRAPGERGGEMNPRFREVRSIDIQAVPFAGIHFDAHGLGCIGEGQALPLPAAK